MKYGIEAQLPAAGADLAHRFLAALMLRMYQVQLGATPVLDNPLDCAIAMMHRWEVSQAAGAAPAPAVQRFAMGYLFGTFGMFEQPDGAYVKHADVAALLEGQLQQIHRQARDRALGTVEGVPACALPGELVALLAAIDGARDGDELGIAAAKFGDWMRARGVDLPDSAGLYHGLAHEPGEVKPCTRSRSRDGVVGLDPVAFFAADAKDAQAMAAAAGVMAVDPSEVTEAMKRAGVQEMFLVESATQAEAWEEKLARVYLAMRAAGVKGLDGQTGGPDAPPA